MRRFSILAVLAMAALLVGAATVWAQERHASPGGAGHRKHTSRHKPKPHRRHHTRHHKRRRHRRPRHRAPGSTTGAAAPAPTTGGAGSTPAAGPCPSGPPGTSQTLGGHMYALEGMDTFTKSAPLGSLAPSTANQIVYVGDHGMGWTGYLDGWPSTHSGGAEGYQPSTVLSVHDRVLDFYLHNDSNGNPVGADPSPLPGGNRYQIYGAWSFCERVAPADAHNLADFHQAPLLWPQNDSDWQVAESDYPEATLNQLDFSGYTHYGAPDLQDAFNIQSVEPSFDPTRWHVYTQAWGPGFRSYYVDGMLVGTSTKQMWSLPERWQLQIEPTGTNDGDSGHVYVKWVWIGSVSS